MTGHRAAAVKPWAGTAGQSCRQPGSRAWEEGLVVSLPHYQCWEARGLRNASKEARRVFPQPVLVNTLLGETEACDINLLA